ncbi:MAG: hypothetical protein HUU38_30875, partial [Anaerolineales bacterium]|nr:hypothetical protein [Anaerolineales bacterium]
MNTELKNLIPETNIRTTEDGKLSVIDVIQELTGRTGKRASEVLKRIELNSEAVSANLRKHKFEGERQRFTPVAGKETIINI